MDIEQLRLSLPRIWQSFKLTDAYLVECLPGKPDHNPSSADTINIDDILTGRFTQSIHFITSSILGWILFSLDLPKTELKGLF